MRPARTLGLALLLISLSLCTPLAPAQQNQTTAPSPPTPTPGPPPLTTKLNVIVLDKNGAPVDDLQQADFQVAEDGKAQTITSFTHADAPVSYMLVIDNTGSMRSQLDLLGRTSAALMAGNRAGDETAITRFVSSDKIEVVQSFTAEQNPLTKALQGLYVEKGLSAVLDAVYLSSVFVTRRSQPDANRRRALILLTDGEERGSYYKQSELLKYLRWANVQVFCIGFVQELDNEGGFIRRSARAEAVKLLDTLAAETGGRVFYPKKIEQLRDAVDAINHDLHTEYEIAYTPTDQLRDDKLRKVQIKLADKPGAQKRVVITRANYVAAKDAPASAKEIEKNLKPLP